MKETIIIGGGIGGMSAAIYAERKRMDYLFFGDETGGQMYESGEILNYPGVIKTTGAEFADTFEDQLKFNDVELNEEKVENLVDKEDHWRVSTGDDTYKSKTIIIATGSRPRKLGVSGEERLANKGVTYCAICDGPLFSDEQVAVVGGGNSALEAVDFMHKIAEKIYLVNIEAELDGHEYLRERVKKMDNVEVVSEASTTEILGKDKVEGIKYEQNGQEKELGVKGVIIEIGRIPNTGIVENILDLDDHNHLKVDRWCRCFMNGEITDRAYGVGDCTDVHEYQYVISAGMGVTALIKAARWLAKQKK